MSQADSLDEDQDQEPAVWNDQLSDYTPRTLMACEMEGVRPQDLAHVPFSWFELPGVSQKIARARHLYFEARRADLLEVVDRARDAIISGQTCALSVMAPRDPDDMHTQYRNTLEFFRRQYATINMTNMTPTKDMTSNKKTMPDVDPPNIPLDAAANNPRRTLSTSMGSGSAANKVFRNIGFGNTSPSEAAERSQSGTGSHRMVRKSSSVPSMPRRSTLSTTWKSIQAELQLHNLFTELAAAPGADFKEHEGIKRTKNNLFALREINLRKQDSAHENQARLAKRRNEASDYQYQRLMECLDEQHESREYREMMAPPHFLDSKRHWRESSRNKRLDYLAERELFAKSKVEERLAKDQALEKWLEEEDATKKMKFAQLTLAERIRWRGQFEQELQKRDNFRVKLVTTFLQNEARAELKAQQVKDNSVFKHELERLRATHRQLSGFQRARKEAFASNVVRPAAVD